MRKLLSAVTSIVMSASFMTSVFASTISASAAGGVSAGQPNATFGEALDVSANKNASEGIELSYKYEEGDCYKAKAGDEIYADLMINSNGNAIFSFDTKYIIDDELEITNVYDVSDAFSCGLTVNCTATATEKLVDSMGNPVDAKVNSVVAIVNDHGTDDPKDDTVEPVVPSSDEVFVTFTVKVPEGTPDGTYYLNIGEYEFNSDNDGTKITPVNYKPAKIVVGDPGEESSSTTTSTSTSTTTTTSTSKLNEGDGINLFYKYEDGKDCYEAEPGD